MILRQDILKGQTCPPEYEANLLELLIRINKVVDACGIILIVTSGLRSRQKQIAVYAEKGITDLDKIPLGSKHLSAQAVDISDPNGDLKKWIMQNIKLIEEIGFWMEDFEYTKGWVHFQTAPPRSGKRFFIPM